MTDKKSKIHPAFIVLTVIFFVGLGLYSVSIMPFQLEAKAVCEMTDSKVVDMDWKNPTVLCSNGEAYDLRRCSKEATIQKDSEGNLIGLKKEMKCW